MNSELIIQYINQYVGFLSNYPYLYALILFIVFLIGAKSIAFIFERFFEKAAKKIGYKAGILIIQKIKRPITLIIVLAGLRLAVVPLNLSAEILSITSKSLSTLGFLIVMWFAIIAFDVVIKDWALKWAYKQKTPVDKDIVNFLEKLSGLIIILLGLMFILHIWQINISPLLASLGLVGFALAFGLQKTLGNLFGGISLLIDRAVSIGDIIELDDGDAGTILDIGLRSTKIRTFDNEVIIVPNGNLAESKIKNYAPPDPSARLVVPFGVAYGSDIEKVKKVVLKAVKGIDEIMEEPSPFVRFDEMAASSLNFKLYVQVMDYRSRRSVMDKVNTSIYNALNKAKIGIPFPQMDVHLKKK